MTSVPNRVPIFEVRLVEVIDTRVDEVRADHNFKHERGSFLAIIVELGQLDCEKSSLWADASRTD